MRGFYKLFFLLLGLLLTSTLFAQDTLKEYPLKSAKKASIMSACLPGLGQAYNHKYWKIPIIYAGFGVIGYAIQQNQQLYTTYKTAYLSRIDNNPNTTDKYTYVYSDDNLREIKNYYKRNIELSYIFAGVLYVLNIVDASVDAHLYKFDVSDQLSLHIQPTLYSPTNETGTGISLHIQFN